MNKRITLFIAYMGVLAFLGLIAAYWGMEHNRIEAETKAYREHTKTTREDRHHDQILNQLESIERDLRKIRLKVCGDR